MARKKKFNWQPLWEATKEPLRLLALAVIPFAIAWLSELDYSWAVAMTILLRWLDKILHELGKASGSEGLKKGITRF